MSDFSTEPTVGSRVDVDIEERESWVTGEIHKEVTIVGGNVTSDTTNSITLKEETFDKIIEWYEDTQ